MTTRVEITRKYATAYAKASKLVKGQILDQVCEVTGWSRDNARRRLTSRVSAPPGHRWTSRTAKPVSKVTTPVVGRSRRRKYSYDTVKVLQRVWATSGGQCGKYLTLAMAQLLANMETHGHLVLDQDHYSTQVRGELLAMSGSTIDRYLKPLKDSGQLKGKSTTTPGTMLRNSITIRRAGDEVEEEPGFFEADTVAHCGPVLKGEFARTVNLVDVHTGWVFTTSIRNNARVHVIAALNLAVKMIPYQVHGLDFD